MFSRIYHLRFVPDNRVVPKYSGQFSQPCFSGKAPQKAAPTVKQSEPWTLKDFWAVFKDVFKELVITVGSSVSAVFAIVALPLQLFFQRFKNKK
ncbi:hypothetical protein [Vampirovibrio sp.]|uniref:hypothetical protein n=1 Tax=Vampirovibrio sp. TaxID=2717857 RepID=UPI003593B3D6